MDGKLFLATACFLRDNGSDEAAYRSAVSRAYYACFLEARGIAYNNCDHKELKRAQISNVRGIRHQDLQKYLKNSTTQNIKRLGQDLAALHGSRLDADYTMDESITIEDAENAIDEAQKFLDDLSMIQPSHVGKAVEDYLKKILMN